MLCGKGQKTVTTVTCKVISQGNILCSNHTTIHPCEIKACHPNCTYGSWSEWTNCKPCRKGIEDKAFIYRNRTSQPSDCNGKEGKSYFIKVSKASKA